jgi:hypothetical protein
MSANGRILAPGPGVGSRNVLAGETVRAARTECDAIGIPDPIEAAAPAT